MDIDIIEKIPWDTLKATWLGLTAIMRNYVSRGEGWATLCEARRLVEVEMQAQGYTDEWNTLTSFNGEDNE